MTRTYSPYETDGPTRFARGSLRPRGARIAGLLLVIPWLLRGEPGPTGVVWVVALAGQSNAGRVAARVNAGGVDLELPPGTQCLVFDAAVGKLKPEPPSDHFGVEVTLAQTVAAQDPGSRVAILRDAVGGQGIHGWYGQGGATDRLRSYAREVSRYRAPEGETRLLGYCWMQGETDAQSQRAARDFQGRLAGLVGNVSRPWRGPPLPFVLCRISAPFDFADQVRAAQEKVAAKYDNVALVSTDGVNPQRGIHYPPTAYLDLGRVIASNLFLLREKLAPAPR